MKEHRGVWVSQFSFTSVPDGLQGVLPFLPPQADGLQGLFFIFTLAAGGSWLCVHIDTPMLSLS